MKKQKAGSPIENVTEILFKALEEQFKAKRKIDPLDLIPDIMEEPYYWENGNIEAKIDVLADAIRRIANYLNSQHKKKS